MKQFIYGPEAAGLSAWPEGTLRLEGIEVTTDPNQADIFVIPGALTQLFPTRWELAKLPYFSKYESRHVAFDCSDNEPLYDTTAMFIRCNTRAWYFKRDHNTIPWPWPVEDYSDVIPVPPGGFKYDVSFHAWIRSHDTRTRAFMIMSTSRLNCDLAGYSDFTGYIWNTPEGIRRRMEFRRSMQESRLALCPESISGVFPYRFWEAMSAGRVPVLVGSEFAFPFANEIDYSSFMIHIERDRIDMLDRELTRFLQHNSDETIIAMGRRGRKAWERCLDSRKWPELHALAVRKKLGL